MTDIHAETDIETATATDDRPLMDRLQDLVGRPLGDDPAPTHGPDPVNEAMIRHWAAAFEDANPIYTDPDAATASRHGGIVAPPLMLQTWIMGTPDLTAMQHNGGVPSGAGAVRVLTLLDEAGFVAPIASNSEYEIERYLHPGERVSATTELESVSPEKKTRLGPGHFVTWVTTYTDAEGDIIGRQRFRMLKFRPEGF